jgi:hypothetical protein
MGLRMLLARWANYGYLPTCATECFRLLPNAPIEWYGQILNNDNTGWHADTVASGHVRAVQCSPSRLVNTLSMIFYNTRKNNYYLA